MKIMGSEKIIEKNSSTNTEPKEVNWYISASKLTRVPQSPASNLARLF